MVAFPSSAVKKAAAWPRLTSVRFGRPKEDGATEEAIEALYRSRFRAFLKVAAGIAGERNAADAVHNGFVRALRHRRSFRGASSLETWVWRTVINAAHDLRSRDRELWLEDIVTEVDTWDIGEGRGSDDDGVVREAILALPSQQRTAVFLRYHADLDYRTIGEILGVSDGTVAATLHKAHAAVRRRLEEAEVWMS